jgi:hypothetical protein
MGIQSRFVCNKNDGDVMVVSLGYQRAIIAMRFGLVMDCTDVPSN